MTELSSQISGYLTGFVRPSVGLSQMNYVEYLLNLTPQLYNSSLAQPVTKQCFMLFSVCVKRALAITENTLQLKVEESFLVLNVYKCYQ